jgi:hypothetical protein
MFLIFLKKNFFQENKIVTCLHLCFFHSAEWSDSHRLDEVLFYFAQGEASPQTLVERIASSQEMSSELRGCEKQKNTDNFGRQKQMFFLKKGKKMKKCLQFNNLFVQLAKKFQKKQKHQH